MKEFQIKLRDIIIFIIVIILMGFSVYLNLGKDDDLVRIILNYIPGTIALLLGLSWKKLSKKMRITYLIFAIIVLGYMALHYLFGFQNHNWGN